MRGISELSAAAFPARYGWQVLVVDHTEGPRLILDDGQVLEADQLTVIAKSGAAL